MTLFPALVLMLTMAILITMAPRIVFAWFQFSELVADKNREGLLALLRQQNGWVVRDFICATFGVALVVLMKTVPNLDQPEHLAVVTAGYVMISFIFALTESLLAQKIARLLRGVTAPTKLSQQ